MQTLATTLSTRPIWALIANVESRASDVLLRLQRSETPVTYRELNAAAQEIRRIGAELREYPGGANTARLVDRMTFRAIGANARHQVLWERGEFLLDAVNQIAAYNRAFCAGQDNPGV